MGAIDLSKHTINLSKGETINLSKASEGLKQVMIGLGWAEVNKTETRTITETVHPGFIARLFGAQDRQIERTVSIDNNAYDLDLDAWVALLDKKGRFENSIDGPLIYYNNKTYINRHTNTRAIKHHGDNLTGGSVGDDEEITIDLSEIPDEYSQILVAVTIYEGKHRHQSFGCVKNTFVRVVDTRDNFEICRYETADMSENKDAITFIVGKFIRTGKDWEFEAIGKCTGDASIKDAINKYR